MAITKLLVLFACFFLHSDSFVLPTCITKRHTSFPLTSLSEDESTAFEFTGIQRHLHWKPVSKPIPIHNEIKLIQSGTLSRRGEFGVLEGKRRAELEAVCKKLELTLEQGLLIRKQVMTHKVVTTHWKLKKSLPNLRRKFGRGVELKHLSQNLDLPPVTIFRALLRERVHAAEELNDLQAREKNQIVQMIINQDDTELVEKFLTRWEIQQLEDAKQNDVVGFGLPEVGPNTWEEALYAFLDDQKIHYAREDAMKLAKRSATPDCLILDDLYINGQHVRWIDAKAFYGSGLKESKIFASKLGRQIQKYEGEFDASGAILFRCGYSKKLAESYPSTLFLDAGPIAVYDFDK